LPVPRILLVFSVLLFAGALGHAQRRDAFVENRDHPAIAYSKTPFTTAVTALNRRLQEGTARLTFDPATGYLRSLLDALNVPIASQVLVFSQTSFQAPLISIRNPRAVYFTDTVAVGWVRGGKVLEIAAQDPKQGIAFYALDQQPASTPQLTRNDECLACHLAWETLGVPGLIVQSVNPLPDDPNAYVVGFTTDHRSPFTERWGGWYVTGRHGGARHMGNVPVMPADQGKSKIAMPLQPLDSVAGLFDMKGYPAPYSDVVALLVLAHQTQMTNLITRVGWESRVAVSSRNQQDAAARVQEAVNDLVDYMLFVDEAPLPGPVRGTSGFAEQFARIGPRDAQGRSLRQLDLERRLMRYPCSYMIYSPAFDALTAKVREQIYARMWRVLSGQESAPRYGRLSRADRQAVLDILRDTRKDLPAFFNKS
jgi:hypothetical protein